MNNNNWRTRIIFRSKPSQLNVLHTIFVVEVWVVGHVATPMASGKSVLLGYPDAQQDPPNRLAPISCEAILHHFLLDVHVSIYASLHCSISKFSIAFLSCCAWVPDCMRKTTSLTSHSAFSHLLHCVTKGPAIAWA